MPSYIEYTNRMELPCSICKTLSLYCLFFFFLILCVAFSKRWVKVFFSVCVKHPYIKEYFLSSNQVHPWSQSSYDLMRVFAALFEKISPVTGNIIGAISTSSLRTLLRNFAVRSRKSSCGIVMDPPLLQLIMC